MRIALLDHEASVLELLTKTLQRQNHVCHAYRTGESLLSDIRRESFDLLVLNGQLPDMQGTDAVRTLRDLVGSQLPILFTTSNTDERSVIEALSKGADDVMSGPLRLGELVARVAALLRRAYPEAMGIRLLFGHYCFDPSNRIVTLHGMPVDLKHREYELALFMFRNTGRLLSRAHLREAIWGDVSDGSSRSLDTHISRVRTKLALSEVNGYHLTATYGMGYRLDAITHNVDLPTAANVSLADIISCNSLPADLHPRLATS